MSKLDRAINIDDLRRMARRRLPRIMFDFIEGGVEDEVGLATNEAAFRRRRLVPRYYVDTTGRHQRVEMFGRTWSSPIGIAPTGLAGAFYPDAELHLARAAAAMNIPYMMSGAANASMEQAVRLAPENLWFQIYGARDRAIAADLVRRAGDIGLKTIVVTADVPVSSNRERNRRNGFGRPLRLGIGTILESLLHPVWLAHYLRHGVPMMGNWRPYAATGASADDVSDMFATQTPDASQTWKDLENIRRLWPGNLMVKGLLHPEDARMAAGIGVNGIVVSNHGGRQLDLAPSPLDVLPQIRAVVGPDMVLALDSGVRRGSDIVLSLCLGANFVFTGRATLYGAIAGGTEGVKKAISILQKEIDLTLGQLGCVDLAALGPHMLLDNLWTTALPNMEVAAVERPAAPVRANARS
ncbi:MAG: alpha-hydroxy acid oxidase [Acetobacteraceae bacterium]